MSLSSWRWTRLARVASATLLTTTAAVALLPSAASADGPATAGAVISAAGCSSSALERTDDGWAAPVALPGTFTFYNRQLKDVTVNVNGTLTFDGPLSTSGFPGNTSIPGHNRAIIAPYYSDADPRGEGSGTPTFGSTTIGGRAAFCATWPAVGYFDRGVDKLSTFQALLVDRSDVSSGAFDLVLNYDQVQWDKGDNSTRFAEAGFSAGTTATSWLAPGSGVAGALLDNGANALVASSKDSAVPGRYVFRFRGGSVAASPDAPQTTLLTSAASRGTAVPSFTYSSAYTGDTTLFECRVTADGETSGAWQECAADGQSYPDLADGAYTFEVRATDAYGNADRTPESATFTLDRTGPATTIDQKPATRGNDSSPTIAFSSTASDVASFECSLDDASWAACTSPASLSALDDGPHTFGVRALDDLGTAGPAASYDFEVDTTGPVTELDETPAALTNDNSPVFTWSSPDEDVDDEAYSCHLDRVPSAEPSPWYDCTSGEDMTNLGDGDWRFQVKGTDDLGNEGDAASYDFTVDTEAPAVELTEKPAARGNDTTPVVAWTSAEDADLFECSLDRTGGEGSPWEECASGDELEVTDGDWTFQVRATDQAGNPGEPTSYAFTVDTAAPAAPVLTSKPKALGNLATPSFAWTADADVDHFMCAVVLVGAQYATPETCTASGFTSEHLADGDYRFTVVAVDAAGNESEPTWFEFTVDTTAPETTVTDAPAATIGTGSATFGWASSESPSTFECRLSAAGQGTAWQACDGSSKAFSGLGDGTYAFEVRATDAAGNTDATPASRTVRVNLGQPTITATVSSPTPISEFGWYRSPVTITYTCAGNGSALVGACPAPRQVPRAQQGKVVFRASVATVDGDTASVSTTLYIDKGKPQVRLKGFSGKQVYTSMPKPRCKASDPRSGLDTCKVTVTKVRKKAGDVFVVVKATAVDKAGNVRVVKKQAPFRAA